jgi:hypothetical protein
MHSVVELRCYFLLLVLQHTVLTATAVESQYRTLSNPEMAKGFVNTKLIKGSLTRDFQLQTFFMNHCPGGPQVFY